MGSVQDYINCPRCKQEDCIDDFYYKTGEESIFCPNCGYHRSFFYKRKDGKFVRKDESKPFTFDNLIAEEVHIEDPYGAYRIESANGSAQLGTLNTKEDYQRFVSEIVSLTNQESEIKEVVVTRLVEDKIEKETLFEKI